MPCAGAGFEAEGKVDAMTEQTAVKPFKEIDFSAFNWRIGTDRYTSEEVQEREKEQIWSKV